MSYRSYCVLISGNVGRGFIESSNSAKSIRL